MCSPGIHASPVHFMLLIIQNVLDAFEPPHAGGQDRYPCFHRRPYAVPSERDRPNAALPSCLKWLGKTTYLVRGHPSSVGASRMVGTM